MGYKYVCNGPIVYILFPKINNVVHLTVKDCLSHSLCQNVQQPVTQMVFIHKGLIEEKAAGGAF